MFIGHKVFGHGAKHVQNLLEKQFDDKQFSIYFDFFVSIHDHEYHVPKTKFSKDADPGRIK